jgi:uncharacterized membrane protein
MPNVVPVGRAFFGVALIAWGVQQFLFGDFVPGRAPAWPASLPGKLFWAYVSGAVFIASGAAILSTYAQGLRRDPGFTRLSRTPRLAALLAGSLIMVWALLRHIPLALADTNFGGAWTALGKALAFTGGALAIAGSLTPRGASGVSRHPDWLIHIGRACLGIFMINSGIQHFIWTDFVDTLVPTWVPGGARFWTYFAGVALIAGGAGMNFRPTARLAALLSGGMVFTWFVILHIPRALAAAPDNSRNEWIAVFEALAVSGIALVVSTASPREHPASKPAESVL